MCTLSIRDSLLVLGSVLAFAGPSLAADEPPVASSLGSYYGGERTSADLVMGIGAVSMGLGASLVTRDSDVARGAGWPLLTIGALEGIGAVFYAFQVDAEIAHYEGLLARDPVAYRRTELTHIHGTTSRFNLYRAIELGLALVGAGLATYGFVAQSDVYKGAGIGIAAEAIPFFIIDTFNQARAARYEAEVRRFTPTIGVQAGSWSLSFAGRF